MATSPKSKPAKAVPAKRVAKPAAKVASKAAGKVAVKAAPKKVARPAVKAAAKPARKPAAKPAVKATVKSVAKPAAKPVSRKAAKPGKPPVIQWKPQKFVVTHLKGAEFKPGLRSYAHYRDLAVEKATGGAVQAHVIRLIGPCDPKVVSLPHYHGVQFQMIYMLKGWMVGEYEGQGKIRMEEGSCWIQPNGIRHTVLDYSHN
ncbi:MAG: hypothetical protein RLZZ03_946, partial [Pseudomonadota bacterium]